MESKSCCLFKLGEDKICCGDMDPAGVKGLVTAALGERFNERTSA